MYTHTSTHTCILKPFEDSKLMGLKVDIANQDILELNLELD